VMKMIGFETIGRTSRFRLENQTRTERNRFQTGFTQNALVRLFGSNERVVKEGMDAHFSLRRFRSITSLSFPIMPISLVLWPPDRPVNF
jgi:hypothetical protein